MDRLVVPALVLLLSWVAAPGGLEAQGSERVLVAPLGTGEGVDGGFGARVARAVGDGLSELAGVEVVGERVVENAMKMFRVQTGVTVLTAIHWRQLAAQLGADRVMVGSGRISGEGVEVEVVFVEPWWGDELAVPAVGVAGDGGSEAKEAARGIVEGFAGELEYLASLRRCGTQEGAEGLAEALAGCERAIEWRPEGREAYYGRGLLLMGLERWAEAIADLETARSAGARLAVSVAAEVTRALAASHLRLGDAERATVLYREALALEPEDVEARLTVARALHEAGDEAAAAAIVRDGLALDPGNPRLEAYLADPAGGARTAGLPEEAACGRWTLEIRNRERLDVEVYRFRGEAIVPLRQAEVRGAQGRFLRVVRVDGLETLTLTGPEPILMFYRYQPARPAERETVLVNGVYTHRTVAEAQPERRTLFALASPFEVEPPDMQRLDLSFTCETN